MADGWVGLHRQIMEHWIYQDAEYLKAWLEMLLRARFSKESACELIDGELITVGYGEFIFGRVKWAERLRIGEQRLRTLIKKLTADGMIELVSTHRKCTLYRVKNYEKYQNFNHHSNQQRSQSQQGFEATTNHEANQRPTISQPAANQQPTTKEESKESNKEIIKTSSTTTTAPRGDNPFCLYETHKFGKLDSMSREFIGDTIDEYTEDWVNRAIKEAVKYNRIAWIYVERILKAWKATGHTEPWTLEKQQPEPPADNVAPINRYRNNYGRQQRPSKPSIPMVDTSAKVKTMSEKDQEELQWLAEQMELRNKQRREEHTMP